jgi:hypothetical protein
MVYVKERNEVLYLFILGRDQTQIRLLQSLQTKYSQTF